MLTNSYQEIADAINLESAQCMALPEYLPSIEIERAYVETRINELANIWRKHGVEPTAVNITCSKAIASSIEHLTQIAGLNVNIISDPYDSDDFEAGTFVIEFESDHPCSMWINGSIGFAFAGPVDPELFAARWKLQVNDGLVPGEADMVSRLM